MTESSALFGRYLRQRQELGEDEFILTDPVEPLRFQPARAQSQLTRDSSAAPPRSGEPASSATKSSAESVEKWRKGAPAIPPPGITIEESDTDLFAADPLADCDLDGLAQIIRSCEKCGLCGERINAVPGEGPPDARLMVIGEGPGANEDRQGRPFVGRAGDLLNNILAAIECPRETVYIANIVKCRPPGNRNPERDEMEQCLPYLRRQIALVNPDVIIALGSVAACTLLEMRTSLGALRNKVHRFCGIPLVVTYHPAALLRNPNWKKPTWDDVRIARRLLDDKH